MPLWSNTDANTSAPKFAVAGGLGVAQNGDALYANTTIGEFVDNLAVGVFAVDAVEMVQPENLTNKPTHTGWILRTEGTGGRTGRIQTEVIVAGGIGEETGDTDDDAIYVDRTITITAQPQDDESASGSEVTFSVTAAASPTADLTYLWQVSTDDGANWASASGTNNAASYVIADNTGLDGNQYRVQVSADGATTVTSDAATLTEAA
jgi:hypothetical protein